LGRTIVVTAAVLAPNMIGAATIGHGKSVISFYLLANEET
jgi:hypothetical protein